MIEYDSFEEWLNEIEFNGRFGANRFERICREIQHAAKEGIPLAYPEMLKRWLQAAWILGRTEGENAIHSRRG